MIRSLVLAACPLSLPLPPAGDADLDTRIEAGAK